MRGAQQRLGMGNTALADIRAMLGVSRHCEELPFLVCVLVSAAVQDRARETIQYVLTTYPKSGPATNCATLPINWLHSRSTGAVGFKVSAPVFMTACNEFTPTTGTAMVGSP